MHTTFEIGPEEWTEGFWRKIMTLFDKKKVRVTVEEIDTVNTKTQYDIYLEMKRIQSQYPPIKVDPAVDISRLADESNAPNLL
ncbi:hypothetical protein [Dyadobacter sp. MSC1_007]|jgi:hypothetical protein|uniref:hypothetical protein n=1 Tax=Dyadobacter sp. MSC1_007 TaxID=2909264 RepID=UPI00202DF4F0|nr:hypothetical protein [Dyadobacter sp. MSC1_007]